MFIGVPDLIIGNQMATLIWHMTNLASTTNIVVQSCDLDNPSQCVITNITDPAIQPFMISITESDNIEFVFEFYDGPDLVSNHTCGTQENMCNPNGEFDFK
jgi:hypothetical protein